MPMGAHRHLKVHAAVTHRLDARAVVLSRYLGHELAVEHDAQRFCARDHRPHAHVELTLAVLSGVHHVLLQRPRPVGHLVRRRGTG